MFLKTTDRDEDESSTNCNRCSRDAVVAVADEGDEEMEALCGTHNAQTVHDIKVFKQ